MSKGEVTEGDDAELFAAVLGRAVEAVEGQEIPYAGFGSIATATYGEPDACGDIDLLVRPQDADRTLQALADRGFTTDRTDPSWIYKATMDGVLVDVIFRTKGSIPLDDEALARIVSTRYSGQPVRLVSPEDALVIEAAGNEPQQPQRWANALSILAASPDLDWDYLVFRARYAAKRTLSLLIYAQSDDLVIPDRAIHALFDQVYER